MVRVSAARPCPVCGKPDWCLVAPDASAAVCARVESGRRCGEAGWLHRMADDPSGHRGHTRRVRLTAAGPDLGPLAQAYRAALEPGRLDQLARRLGVSTASLTALSVGWSAGHGAYSFPMADADGRVVGIRLRRPDGRKFAVRGGREGLFLPAANPDPAEPVLVTEGPTDAAAALTLGWVSVVGRPSCAGGTRLLVALLRSRRPPGVVIVADGDGPGRAGADRLADELTKFAREVRVVTPRPGPRTCGRGFGPGRPAATWTPSRRRPCRESWPSGSSLRGATDERTYHPTGAGGSRPAPGRG